MAGLTDVSGIKVGHAQDLKAATGLTVILCPDGAVGGMTVRGGATSIRQAGVLNAGHMVEVVHAVLFTGGSAFGLDAAAGVMSFLEESGVGLEVGEVKVPIVPAAVIFDLGLGDPKVRPDAAMAFEACRAASAGPVEMGSVGVGCGASVGKLHGITQATKGGLGSASVTGPDGLVVGGLLVTNAFGDIVDPETGRIIAGAREAPNSSKMVDTEARIRAGENYTRFAQSNTTLGLVATNARFDREGCCRLARLAELGLTRTIRPYGTLFDGDLVIVLSLGQVEADLHTVGLLASQVLARSALQGVRQADGLGLVPAYRDLAG